MKIKIDHRGQDPSDSTRSFEQPTPGVYRAKIDDATVRFTGTGTSRKLRDIELVVKITEGDYNGTRLWDYPSFSEAAQWKMDQMLLAVGHLSTRKRTKEFSSEKELEKSLKGKTVSIRIRGDSYEGEYRARISQYMAPLDEDEDAEEEEEFEDETEEVGYEDVEDESDDEDEGEEVTFEMLKTASIKELRDLADEFELDHSGLRKTEIRDMLIDELGLEEDEEEPPF